MLQDFTQFDLQGLRTLTGEDTIWSCREVASQPAFLGTMPLGYLKLWYTTISATIGEEKYQKIMRIYWKSECLTSILRQYFRKKKKRMTLTQSKTEIAWDSLALRRLEVGAKLPNLGQRAAASQCHEMWPENPPINWTIFP